MDKWDVINHVRTNKANVPYVPVVIESMTKKRSE
jgi:hypothetical protein